MITVCSTGTEEHFSSGLLWIHSLPAFVLGIAPTQVQHFALGLGKLHELWTCPFVKTVKIPLDHILSLQRVWPWKLVSSPNLLTVHSISVSMLLEKMLNNISPDTDPWRAPLITGLHLDTESFTTTISVQPSSPFWIYWMVHPKKSTSFQLRHKGAVWLSVKHFAQTG